MAFTGNRNLADTAETVGRWLAGKLGVDRVEVGEVSSPKAGFSNETLFLTASWDHAGARREERLVLRIEPTDHQLFVQPDAMFQARMMTALRAHPGIPAPLVWFTEPDPSVLGGRSS